MSHENYRKGFDISFPLFSRNHPERGPEYISPSSAKINFVGLYGSMYCVDILFYFQEKPNIEILGTSNVKTPKYLLVFKGKRYIYGIGSETRNAIHHLHNNKDILIYTTCKHGKKWKELVDERCEQDNIEYEK